MFPGVAGLLLMPALCASMMFGARTRGAEWIVYEPKPGPGMGKHIVFLTGDEEYRSEEGMPMMAKILSQKHGFKCTVLFPIDKDGTINPDVTTNLPGAEAMDSADCIVMQLRFRNWPDDQMKHFVAALDRGVPIIGLRTSTHAFNFSQGSYKSYNEFGKRVFGEHWVNHWSNHRREATKGIIEESAKGLPIMRGVSDIFGLTDVYEAYPPKDVTILFRGQALRGMKETDEPADYKKRRATDHAEQGINDPMMPVAWTRVFKNENGKQNKILCTTMGAAVDLRCEGLRRLVVNAVYWGLDMDIPAKADVNYVDPFDPWMYGFGTGRKGIRPEDHALGLELKQGNAPKPAQ